MLLKDFNYWGSPGYPVTIEDEKTGHPIGWADKHGTYFDLAASNPMGPQTVWNGTQLTPNGGLTKGRLLPIDGPPYVDSLHTFARLMRVTAEDLKKQQANKQQPTATTAKKRGKKNR
jgi:hypothetical protein